MEKIFLMMIFVILVPDKMFLFIKCRMIRGGKACGTYGEKRGTYSVLVVRTEGTRQHVFT
jgi:hypothetical protein